MDEAESAALRLNELDPSEASRSAAAALCGAFQDCGNMV